MKCKLFFIVFLVPFMSLAQQTGQALIHGSLYSNQRMLLDGSNEWAWNENRFELRFDKRSEKIRFYANTWLRYLGAPQIYNSRGLFLKDNINPWNLDLREAYAEVNGFLTDKVDMKIGRQRIAWGTADKFNPTDNLNPLDLEDLTDFGRYNGSDAVNITWHPGSTTSLQVVYIPFFRPANLPLGIFSGLFSPGVTLPPGMSLHEYSDKVKLPDYSLTEGATLGLRLKGFVFNTDLSLSYLYGYNGLPLACRATLTPIDQDGNVDIHSELVFPRRHIIGADLAGSIGSVGVWAETALFLPEKEIVLTTDLSALYPYTSFPVTIDSVVLKKAPYLKYVIGADYTLHNGIYMNLQYIHGFFHEQGKGNLNDYMMFAIEKKMWDDRLLFRPLAGGIVVSNWNKPSDNYALIYSPELSYRGIDNLDLGISALFFDGKGTNMFAGLKDYNMLILKAKISF